MKKLATVVLSLMLLSLAPTAPAAEGYRYMAGAELASKLKAGASVIVLDIQAEPEYREHHIKGAVPTYAYPVKSAEDRVKLDRQLKAVAASDSPVVLVCPRGAGGAERTYDYLKEKGVPAGRLYILEKGQTGWNYAELTEGK